MKLRYYMRGLATGILVTTLILTIANTNHKPLTDAQIRQRALELGMVDSESVKLSSLQSEESTVESSSTENPSRESTVSENATPESSATEENTAPSATPITIVIKSGANSYTVSKDLAAAGLVEDAKAYDSYLCKNGYAQKIRVGSYEIMPGSSEEEIAIMITK